MNKIILFSERAKNKEEEREVFLKLMDESDVGLGDTLLRDGSVRLCIVDKNGGRLQTLLKIYQNGECNWLRLWGRYSEIFKTNSSGYINSGQE